MARKPYVGITDFMNQEQVWRMLTVLVQSGGGILGRRLMVGVMMSYKTLHDLPTKWDKAFPPKKSIHRIFSSHPLLFNVLHYADYAGIDIAESLAKATLWGGIAINGIQLDMIWPDANIVRAYREKHPYTQVIIQGNARAMEAVANDPIAFAERLRNYGDVIDYVLLDKSMGKGLGMDAQALLPFAREIKDRLPNLNLAAAGGLGPDTIHLVEPLVKEFPEISIDAQGKLRPSGSALDPIDWGMASRYMERALKLFEQRQSEII